MAIKINFSEFFAAQSWFEAEKANAENESAIADEDSLEVIQPSVPASSEPDDSKCCVCQDAFENFYNEDREEWCFRPAVAFENKNYHPLCLDDHKVCRSILFPNKSLKFLFLLTFDWFLLLTGKTVSGMIKKIFHQFL